MAEVPNIFHSRLPAGQISGSSDAVLGEPIHLHRTLTQGIAASKINLVDSVDISEAAHVAQEVSDTSAELTGSPNGPNRIPEVHPIINGIANIRQAALKLANGR